MQDISPSADLLHHKFYKTATILPGPPSHKMKAILLFSLATLCLFSVMSEVKAADNEWLPYFILMSNSGPAPTMLSPAVLLTIGMGAIIVTQLIGGDKGYQKA